jgi:small GTP-binding protein
MSCCGNSRGQEVKGEKVAYRLPVNVPKGNRPFEDYNTSADPTDSITLKAVIIGSKGVGKTTLFKILCGEYSLDTNATIGCDIIFLHTSIKHQSLKIIIQLVDTCGDSTTVLPSNLCRNNSLIIGVVDFNNLTQSFENLADMFARCRRSSMKSKILIYANKCDLKESEDQVELVTEWTHSLRREYGISEDDIKIKSVSFNPPCIQDLTPVEFRLHVDKTKLDCQADITKMLSKFTEKY